MKKIKKAKGSKPKITKIPMTPMVSKLKPTVNKGNLLYQRK